MFNFWYHVRKMADGVGGMEWREKVNTDRPNLQHKKFVIDISKKLSSDKYSKAQE